MLIHPYSSPIGAITLAADGKFLTGLWFDGQKYDRRGLGDDVSVGNCVVFDRAGAWLDAYFSGDRPDLAPMLRLVGTPFQMAVWELLQEIPYGQTTTYGALARELERKTGRRTSARAVGSAAGRNPISIIVPCHRVLGTDRSLTGYAGGVERKRALLTLEGAISKGLQEASSSAC